MYNDVYGVIYHVLVDPKLELSCCVVVCYHRVVVAVYVMLFMCCACFFFKTELRMIILHVGIL